MRIHQMKFASLLCILIATSLQAAEPQAIQPKDITAWESQRAELKAAWLKLLGPMPATKPPLKLEVVSEEKLPEFTRQYVRYQVEDGVWTDGYLLIPPLAQGARTAGVVVFHSTVKQQARLVAGVDQDVPDKMQGVHMAKLGFVALCPRNYIFDEGADFNGNVAKLNAKHPDWSGMLRMLLDGMRAVDVLQSLPQVDGQRIGTIGHSLGAKEALYMSAFDERVTASVSSEGGVGMSMSNWEATWYLGPQAKAPDFAHDHHELLALIAPRALLLLGGNSADTDADQAYVNAALPVFKLYKADDHLAFFNHHLGHAYPPLAREKAEAFLLRFLKK
ncbi:MAG: dienelactone hydrolase-like enzyme [Verrucomicrobiaceae bacterium]|nr:dienelactone hydrolase-like enzyme [Verrucomicrobiaceae bacterium]